MFGDLQGSCLDCGDYTEEGEAYCPACLAAHNGGRCICGGCTNKAAEGRGYCDEHLDAMQESYEKLWKETYCRHGYPRDLDCGECDAENNAEYYYCHRCNQYIEECACYVTLEGGERLIRPESEVRLIVDMYNRESNWNRTMAEIEWMQSVNNLLGLPEEFGDEIPF